MARNGRATVFPQAIGMAATWDKELIFQVATAISDEGRAKYHEALRRNGYTDQYQGLTFWSPNVNIFRDPRWGRGQETWGEDPFFTGEMASEFVKGLQGDHPKYLKAAACAKHYAVHSGPEKDRHTFNAIVTKRELYDTYLPAFKKLVTDARVESVMGAYNRTLDEVCCASKLLIEKSCAASGISRGTLSQIVGRCPISISITRSQKMRPIPLRWLCNVDVTLDAIMSSMKFPKPSRAGTSPKRMSIVPSNARLLRVSSLACSTRLRMCHSRPSPPMWLPVMNIVNWHIAQPPNRWCC